MELFKLLGKIIIDNNEANDKMDETTTKAKDSEGKLKNIFSKIGGFALKAGKVAGAGIVAGSTALAGLTKVALGQYAEYEQLVGGIETLFGNSSSKMIEYANNAYMTAGMSANEYMDTVTSFSASLIASLDGDTAKATEYANMAITDMSDNANKMGTSIDMIQNAYQGFAKQNYTMLDNLKLGYGGTREEMQRLIDDANRINAENGKSTQYQIDNYADMVDAIHTVQTEMGITGTTSKEASQTISGSVNMMKGAWRNFLTGMADENADFGALVDNLVNSVITVGDNIGPRLQILIPKLVDGLVAVISKIGNMLPPLISTLIPAIIQGGAKLIQAIITLLPMLINMIIAMLPEIINGILQLINAVVQALPSLISTIVQALPQLINIIMQGLISNLPSIIGGLIMLFVAIVEALPTIIAILVQSIPMIIQLILKAVIDNLPIIIQALIQLVGAIVTALPQIILALITAIPGVIMAILGAFASLPGRLIQGAMHMVIGVKNVIVNTFTNIITIVITAFLNIKSIAVNVWNGIKNAIITPINIAKNAVKSAIDKMKGFFKFKWSLPKLKLPHISISGKFSLKPPKAPKFAIKWYKSAMDKGMIMNSPTIFGYDQATNKLMAGGEAGSETVVGTNSLMNMIRNAVNENNNVILLKILEILEKIDSTLVDKFIEAIKGTKIEVNDRELGRFIKKYA